jgi:SHAQKYF class myb-like DNA-binding protein
MFCSERLLMEVNIISNNSHCTIPNFTPFSTILNKKQIEKKQNENFNVKKEEIGLFNNCYHKINKQGKWTKTEHRQFLSGMKKHGNSWALISKNYIKTRNTNQIASHAQSYFKKLCKRNGYKIKNKDKNNYYAWEKYVKKLKI